MKERYTLYSDVDTVLEKIITGCRQVFRERLTGIYLYGSVVSGDFDNGISDIDLLVVTASPVTPAEYLALQQMHDEIVRYNPEWDDRIDAVYLPATDLKNFRTAGSPIVISPGEPFHTREGEPLIDWLQNWYLVRESGKALSGPPPDEIIPLISRDEFIEASRNYAREVNQGTMPDADLKNQSYAILTMCRAFCTCRTGKQVSKLKGAGYVQELYPQWKPLIERAFEWRKGHKYASETPGAAGTETVRFLNFVKQQILL